MTNRVFVDQTRTALVEMWEDGTVTVATRAHSGDIWGPPRYLTEEGVDRTTANEGADQPETLLRSPGANEEGT